MNKNENQHSSHCSCGHDHSNDHQHKEAACHSYDENPTINADEKALLLELQKNTYLPISQFIMSSSIEEEAAFIALEPVYIENLNDTMETVKAKGAVLCELEKKGLITLDYDIPIERYDYRFHTNSKLFAYFKQTIDEGRNNPNFLCDTAEIEPGSIALTELGLKIVKHLI